VFIQRAAKVFGMMALIVVMETTSGSAQAASAMQVLQRWSLGGDGGWDYLTVDSQHRLFLSRGTRVDVVDTRTGKVSGTIPDTQGVHGVALAPELHRGFTSNGRADSVTVFDLDTLKTLQVVKVPAHNPDCIVYDPVGKHVFTFNGRSKDVTVLDATTLAVVATIPVPDKPEFAQDDLAGHIFVNIESDPGQMVVIDSRKLTVQSTWPLPGMPRSFSQVCTYFKCLPRVRKAAAISFSSMLA